jgi:hypothetical protein
MQTETLNACQRAVKECARPRARPGPLPAAPRRVELLPVEAEARQVIERKEEGLACAKHDAKYPRMDTSFLAWTTKVKRPIAARAISGITALSPEKGCALVTAIATSCCLVLGLALPSGPLCGIGMGFWLATTFLVLLIVTGDPSTQSGPQQVLRPQFAVFDAFADTRCQVWGWEYAKVRGMHRTRSDPISTLRAKLPRPSHPGTAWSCSFTGVIPDESRQKIREARKEFDAVALICEVTPEAWAAERIETDPLILGLAGGEAWLVGWFDLTPTEDYVLGMYSTGKKLGG